jgi:hypothetical protein
MRIYYKNSEFSKFSIIRRTVKFWFREIDCFLNPSKMKDCLFRDFLIFDGFLEVFTCHIWNMREYWFRVEKNEKEIIADFHVLELFMANKHDLSEKKISFCQSSLP